MIKNIHVTTAVISIILFNIRWVGRIRGAGFMRQRWVRILPHINDSILLLTAFLLAYSLGQYPFTAPWLSAKFLALIGYILAGMMALKWCQRYPSQLGAWVGAQLLFFYIISVAITRSTWGFLVTLQ